MADEDVAIGDEGRGKAAEAGDEDLRAGHEAADCAVERGRGGWSAGGVSVCGGAEVEGGAAP